MINYSRRDFISRTATGAAGLGLLPLWSATPVLGVAGRVPIPLIVDADTANEVDDLYAIAIALLAPELDVRGLTSAQYHTQERAPRDSVQ